MDSNLDIASYVIDAAKKLGATDADAIIVQSNDTSLRTRLGKFETIEMSESRDLGIRILIEEKAGFKTAVISTNNLQKNNITETIKHAIETANIAPEDNHSRLANENEFAKKITDLKISDGSSISNDELKSWAIEAENAALEVKGVTNSDGADASTSMSETVMVTSKGFSGIYKSSGYNISVSVIAGSETAMETDYEYSYVRHKKDIASPAEVGKKAGEITVKKLNPRKIKTCKVPIIFDPRVSKSMLSSLCGSINGSSIVKKSSFLTDKMGQQIFPANINIVDDPTIEKGLSSEPFDAEGIKGEKLFLVENGVLKSWILDMRSASKLGLKSNGRASRGISTLPSPSSTNVYMSNGKISDFST